MKIAKVASLYVCDCQ